ncbi:hypothetical protein JVT61DRAFT_6774 [Boletus reticuloceps]|uniref:SEC63 domain-containing protein n=1 Tax=Boletus reticuloceps TaxID=495285 RepID=A0A8I3A7L7_9AGAM|nr:hypothetical protein JVT61DRAFT_6774 [Boletus reticuloceps]
MLGRAGQPQYDTYGEGIIITNHSNLQYYLSLMNQQLPIESQFISKLADNLNAEIVFGTVRNRDEAVQWLGYTYLYPDSQKHADVIHSAVALLEKCHHIKYERSSGQFQSSELGRIASHYYVTHNSMATYKQHLWLIMSTLELFRVFALSNKFKLLPVSIPQNSCQINLQEYLKVRQEEKLELAKLLERVPTSVKESVDEPTAKINVLLQAYISQLKLEGFALVADTVFVQQSAGHILHAMFEICLKRGWAMPAWACLALCKMVERRMWGSMTPLCQFKGVSQEVIQKAEGSKQFPAWYRYFDLDPPELGELIGIPNAGRLVHNFPKLQLQVQVQPITRFLLRIDLSIVPDFRWDEKIHGGAETFFIIIEDIDGEIILFHDTFIVLCQRYTEDEHNVTITVPIFEPVPPDYYISVVSDQWLHAETRLSTSFSQKSFHLRRPSSSCNLCLSPRYTTRNMRRSYLNTIQTFNKIQTQVFQALYSSDKNVFVGAPTGSSKTICAKFALLKSWNKRDNSRADCVEPYQEIVDQRVTE